MTGALLSDKTRINDRGLIKCAVPRCMNHNSSCTWGCLRFQPDQNLTVEYGGQVLVVDDLSLEIPSGQFLAVVGPSGCGKTTLLNLLTGLVPLEKARSTLAASWPT